MAHQEVASMIALVFVLFALLIVARLIAPNPASKPVAEQVANGSLRVRDVTA
jgi:hypothetical protein